MIRGRDGSHNETHISKLNQKYLMTNINLKEKRKKKKTSQRKPLCETLNKVIWCLRFSSLIINGM